MQLKIYPELGWEEGKQYTTNSANTFELNEICGIQRTDQCWVCLQDCACEFALEAQGTARHVAQACGGTE